MYINQHESCTPGTCVFFVLMFWRFEVLMFWRFDVLTFWRFDVLTKDYTLLGQFSYKAACSRTWLKEILPLNIDIWRLRKHQSQRKENVVSGNPNRKTSHKIRSRIDSPQSQRSSCQCQKWTRSRILKVGYRVDFKDLKKFKYIKNTATFITVHFKHYNSSTHYSVQIKHITR